MKLGISGQALGNVKSFREIVQIGKRLDIENFEIWPCNVEVSADYGDADASRITSLLKEEHVTVDCVTLGAAYDKDICSSPKTYEELLYHAIEFAARIGAKLVNHYCYWISREEIPDLHRMEEFWAGPLDFAKREGICLVLENEAHDSTRTPESMRTILDHFHDPFFKTNYDVTNYYHASCEGFPAGYEILKPYIGYVHLKNGCLYREGAGQPDPHRGMPMSGLYAPTPIQYAPIPDGAVNIAGLLFRLQEEKSYSGTCTLEPHTQPDFVEDFYRRESNWLRALGFFQK